MLRLLLLPFLLTALGAVGPAQARELRVGVFDNEPIVLRLADGGYGGLAVDVLDEVARREGWTIVYRHGTFEQLLHRLDTGEIDLAVGVAYSEARAQRYQFNHVPLLSNWATVYAAPGVAVSTVVDLDGKRVASLRGGIHTQALTELLDRFGVHVTLVEAGSYDEAMALVSAGEADAAVVNRVFSARRAGHYSAVSTPIIFNPINVHYAAPLHADPAVLAALDRDLLQMKVDPDSVYHRSIEHWLGGAQREIPRWVPWALAVLAGGLALLIANGALLRMQVRRRTAELAAKTRLLEREVSLRAETEAALRDSEERWSFALEGGGQGVWDWDVATGEVYYSPTWQGMLGYAEGEIPPHYEEWVSRIHPEDRDAAVAAVNENLEGDSTRYHCEHRLRTKRGDYLWVLGRGKVMERDAQGRALRMIGTMSDISAAKAAEAALREERDFSRAVFDTTQALVAVLDREGRIVLFNQACERTTGYSFDEVRGRAVWDFLIPPEQIEPVREVFANLESGDFPSHYENYWLTKDGSRRLIAWSNTCLFDARGEVAFVVPTGIDVTELKRIEAALRTRLESQQVVQSISTRLAFVTPEEFESRLEGAMRTIGQVAACGRVYVAEYSASEGRISITREWCAPGIASVRAQYQRMPIQEMPYLALRLTQGKVVQLPSVSALPDAARAERERLERMGVKSLFLVPVARDGDLLVVGYSWMEEDRQWGIDETFMLRVVGDVIGNAIARLRQEEELRSSEQRMQALLQHSSDVVSILEADGTLRYNSPAIERIHGYRPEDLAGTRTLELIHPDDRMAVKAAIAALLADPATPQVVQYRFRRRDGEYLWMEAVGSNQLDNPAIRGIVANSRDIDRRKRDEDQLRQAATVFESTRDGVMITDAQERIITVNPAFSEITGYSAEEVLGQTPAVLRSGRQGPEFYAEMSRALQEHGAWQGELWNRRKSGEIYAEWLSISVVRDPDGRIARYVGVFSDISQLKISQERLEFLAHHDPLTGLPNRVMFCDRLELAMHRADREGTLAAVLFLDLDRFKHVNDSLGHSAGDLLLQQVAERLQDAVRRQDTVARQGGDEFTLLLDGLHDGERAAGLAQKLVDAIALPFVVDGHELFLGASIGISVYPVDGRDVESLLRNADAAMYRAKEAGRNTYAFYSEEMTSHALERVLIEGQLRRAIERDELVLHYQPQIDLASGRLVGVEALVRWEHPTEGILPPARFIPVAEESGLMLPLGEWVLREACRQTKAWLDAGLEIARVAVNVAGPQIQRGQLGETVRRVLAQTGLPPERLELEITEDFLMAHAEQTVALLTELRSLGVGLAIDDFGTGYSSLAYLKRLPVDKLKIDRSFVYDLPSDENDAAIANAIIALGRSLRIRVIAEGVETPAQRQFLIATGCDEAQGYLFSRPLAADALEAFLRQA